MFMSFFFTLFFYYDWIYASIRNNKRARGSFCFLDQSAEPFRYWAEVQGHLVSVRIWWAAVHSEPVLWTTGACLVSVSPPLGTSSLSLILNLAVTVLCFCLPICCRNEESHWIWCQPPPTTSRLFCILSGSCWKACNIGQGVCREQIFTHGVFQHV